MKDGQGLPSRSKICYKNCSIHEDLLYSHSNKGTYRICIPNHVTTAGGKTLREQFVQDIHDSVAHVHLGVSRTLYEVERRAYWKGLTADVKHYVSACEECQRNKPARQKQAGYLTSTQKPYRPGTHYAMGFLARLPQSSNELHDCIMLVVDRYSKRETSRRAILVSGLRWSLGCAADVESCAIYKRSV